MKKKALKKRSSKKITKQNGGVICFDKIRNAIDEAISLEFREYLHPNTISKVGASVLNAVVREIEGVSEKTKGEPEGDIVSNKLEIDFQAVKAWGKCVEKTHDETRDNMEEALSQANNELESHYPFDDEFASLKSVLAVIKEVLLRCHPDIQEELRLTKKAIEDMIFYGEQLYAFEYDSLEDVTRLDVPCWEGTYKTSLYEALIEGAVCFQANADGLIFKWIAEDEADFVFPTKGREHDEA